MSADSKYECYISLLSVIDWQRSNADGLIRLIEGEQAWYEANHCDWWNNWLSDVFCLQTANDFGLGVWAIILNEPVYGVTQASPEDYPAWGFGEFRQNFNNGNFGSNDDSGYNFTAEQRRILLLMKAFILHMSGSVHGDSVVGINEGLERIFGVGEIYCIDNRDMTFTYIIYDEAVTGIIYELSNRDLLPRPVGIEISVVIDGNVSGWGFGVNHDNFNNGNFYNGQLIGGYNGR